jgi:hypothetical protein
MKLSLSILAAVAVVCSVAFPACKAKKGAGSANVRTLSLKTPGLYTLSLGNKNLAGTTSFTTKELEAADKMKVMSQGKEVNNVTIKFKVKLLRADAEAGAAENDGTELSAEVKELLKSAASGDKLNFEAIRITPQGGEEVSYPPMSFTVK